MIAPVTVTACVLVYLVFYFRSLIDRIESPVLRLLLVLVPVVLGAAMIGVCAQRIKEIKGGEEDDLGQY